MKSCDLSGADPKSRKGRNLKGSSSTAFPLAEPRSMCIPESRLGSSGGGRSGKSPRSLEGTIPLIPAGDSCARSSGFHSLQAKVLRVVSPLRDRHLLRVRGIFPLTSISDDPLASQQSREEQDEHLDGWLGDRARHMWTLHVVLSRPRRALPPMTTPLMSLK